MKSVLVAGLGEVGRPLYEIILEANKYEVYGYDIDKSKTVHKLNDIPEHVDILHICYPYSSHQQFVKTTIEYMNKFKPDITIINSTVIPGTTMEIYSTTKMDIVHSPVRGVHIRMKEHLKFWTKFIGPVNERAALKAKEHFETIGIKVKILKSPYETELAKLFETVYRALMIAFWQEMHRIALKYNADIREIAEFIADTHKVLHDRPIYYPGVIGGHCLIPNTKLLRQCYPQSKFLEAILESNERRELEIKDPKVKSDTEKIKELWKELVPKWYFGIK